MTGIHEMFADLDGYARLDVAIEQWGTYCAARQAERSAMHRERVRANPVQDAAFRARAVERTRQWRIANRERHLEILRESSKRYARKHPEKRKAAKKRYLARRMARDPEKLRERNRLAKQRERTRKAGAA